MRRDALEIERDCQDYVLVRGLSDARTCHLDVSSTSKLLDRWAVRFDRDKLQMLVWLTGTAQVTTCAK